LWSLTNLCFFANKFTAKSGKQGAASFLVREIQFLLAEEIGKGPSGTENLILMVAFEN